MNPLIKTLAEDTAIAIGAFAQSSARRPGRSANRRWGW